MQAATISAIPRYDVCEAVLRSAKPYANSFTDVAVTATFTAPSGRELTAPGFYDGENTWRIRLAPDEVGTWRYRTVATDVTDAALHDQRGSFACVPSPNRGFIQVDPRRRYYFSFGDGTPFFAMGDTCTVTCPTLSDANRRAYLDARARKPFNFVRNFSVQNVFNAWTGAAQVGSPDGWPWGGTPSAPDYDRLNPAYFHRFEHILSELKARGMYAEIIVFNYYEKPFRDPSTWTPDRERLWARYLISRLAADTTVFLWTVTQEYERYPDGKYVYDPADDVWVRQMASLFHQADPYQHPVTVHPWASSAGRDESHRGRPVFPKGVIGQRFGSCAEVDVLTQQENSYSSAAWTGDYQDGPATEVGDAVEADRIWNKPVINTEFGYDWLAEHPATFNRQVHGTDKGRRSAWRLFTAGGAGLAAGFWGT